MTDHPERKKAKCLCIDIETSRQDSLVIREIGVFRPDTGEEMRISGKSPDLRAKLDKISEGAAFVLGHNIIAFDQPALAILHPDLALHRLPLVDTLELSPLAFPQNPYHHLVKDYKLCSTTRNNPVRDAELAYELFLDQDQALRQRQLEHPDEVLCLHYLLTEENGKGIANFLATVRGALRPPLTDTQAAWLRLTDGKICRTGQRQVVDHYLTHPDWQKPLAYVLAWLRIAAATPCCRPGLA